MNKILSLSLLIFTSSLFAQVEKSSLKAVPIIEKRVYQLDGGVIVLEQSRVTMDIYLPPNTVEWYYVFSSYSDVNAYNSRKQGINLLSQLTKIIDNTGTTSLAINALLAPSGSSAANVYLFNDKTNANNFYNKVEQDIFTSATWSYSRACSIETATQGKAKIPYDKSNVKYLGIKAGSSPVVVEIEVVAIVEEKTVDNTLWTIESKNLIFEAAKSTFIEQNIKEPLLSELSNCVTDKIITKYSIDAISKMSTSEQDAMEITIINECEEELQGGKKTAEEEKGLTYGNLAWRSYENGELDKAIELSLKALQFDKTLGFVHANLGLFALLKNDQTKAFEYYIDAISYLKKDKVNGKESFKAVIEDIYAAKQKYPTFDGYQEILAELESEYKNL